MSLTARDDRVRLRQGRGARLRSFGGARAAGAKAAGGPAEIARQGAGAALAALLDDDSLTASSKLGGQISERGARRLFDRLVALGAIRELTGRATFRLYGL